jgi:hypothetical protein
MYGNFELNNRTFELNWYKWHLAFWLTCLGIVLILFFHRIVNQPNSAGGRRFRYRGM